MNFKKLLSLLLLLMSSFMLTSAFAADITPENLRCEYLENPGQVDVLNPRFSWINTPARGKSKLAQSAYELRVASSLEQLKKTGDVWSTGKVASAQSLLIHYAGAALKSGATYYWQVRVWDQKDKASKWSSPAQWTMGMLNASDWKCQWIGAPWQSDNPSKFTGEDFPAPLLRKAFSIDRPVKSVHFFGTGLGYFELYINGSKVSDNVLCPNQSNYGKRPGIEKGGIPMQDNFKEYRVLYVGYDVTSLVRQGNNVVGAILGNGFYNQTGPRWDEPYGSPRFYGQLVIDYADGSRAIVGSDGSWRAAKSAIVTDGIYTGEVYDATLEKNGWSTPAFDASSWQPVVLRNAPYGHLVAQNGPADKVVDTFKPLKIEKIGDGHFKVYFPVEISGWAHLFNIKAPKGNKITIKYISESPLGINEYTCNGSGNEQYNARFTWFVFSQLEVNGWQGELTPADITAEAVNAAVPVVGKFECSNDLFNTINKIYVRSELDNLHGSIASDCPHRERTAYTGDGEVSCPAAMSNLGMDAFYNKWIADIRGAQNVTTGFVPNSAPWQPGAGGGVPWGAAMNIMPWEYYLSYGDLDLLAANFDAMKAQVGYMKTWVEDGDYIMEKKDPCYWETLGDWVPPYEMVPNNLVHTWYYWRCADITAKVASLLGHNDDAASYSDLAAKIKHAFQTKFYDVTKGTYGPYGGNIFALAMGIPDYQVPRVLSALNKDIQAKNGHLDTGIFGTSLFFTTLAKYGLSDVAYEAMNKTDYPSFGNWIRQGATTTWEQWNGENSRNHPMFGGGLVWFYRDLAGMNYDANAGGYRHIIFAPIIPSKLTSASYSKVTPYGLAGIKWLRVGNTISFEVTVPVGSTASVNFPGKSVQSVTKGLTPKCSGDVVTCDVPQGTYTFVVAQ